jgi:hypothetical protein
MLRARLLRRCSTVHEKASTEAYGRMTGGKARFHVVLTI